MPVSINNVLQYQRVKIEALENTVTSYYNGVVTNTYTLTVSDTDYYNNGKVTLLSPSATSNNSVYSYWDWVRVYKVTTNTLTYSFN